MATVRAEILFDLPWFLAITEFLDARSSLRLRSSCARARGAFSDSHLSSWRHRVVLPEALQRRAPAPPPFGWSDAPVATDAHLSWIFDNSPDVTDVDLRDAPHPTDALLWKIATECPGLRSFSVRRGRDSLRLSFHEALQGLTAGGVTALISGCPRLEWLCLSWCEHVSGDEVCEAIGTAPSRATIASLNLDGVRTSDAAIASLATCVRLREVRLRDTAASDLSPLAACSELETLHVCRGHRVRPEGITAACAGFGDSIRVLCCAGCLRVDGVTAMEVLEMCPNLEIWNLRGTGVQNEDSSFELISAANSERHVCLNAPDICAQ